MSQSVIFLGLLLLAVILETVADISFKFSHLENKSIYLWAGVVLYTIGTIVWAFSLRHEFLSKAISLFSVLNMIAVILVGVLFFKEDITLVNKIGIGVGVLAVILMEL